MRYAERVGLEKVFKLRSSITTTNMVLFNDEGKIVKYDSALSILQDFCKVRRVIYTKRKVHLVAKLTREQEILSNKARFIRMVIEGELELRKKKKAQLLKELKKLGFKQMSKIDTLQEGGERSSAKDAGAAAAVDESEKSDYDYLLGMNFWSLTEEKVEELNKQSKMKTKELNELQKKTVEDMWEMDLQALSNALDEIEAQEKAAAPKKRAVVDGIRLSVTAPPSSFD